MLLDQRLGKSPLAADELQPIPLERALSRAAFTQRLALGDQRPDPPFEALDGVLVHDWVLRLDVRRTGPCSCASYSPRVIEFGFAVDVARPPEKVFAYLSDPEKLSEWQGAAEVTQLTDGPVGPGTRFREVHVAMGRRMESVTEFAEYEPPRRLRVRIVEGPLPVDGLGNSSRLPGTRAFAFRPKAQQRESWDSSSRCWRSRCAVVSAPSTSNSSGSSRRNSRNRKA